MFNRPFRSFRSGQSGFTLIEVLVVIVLAAALAAIAAPSWLNFLSTRRLDAGIDEIYIAMREAQSKALRTKRTWEVNVTTEGDVIKVIVGQEGEDGYVSATLDENIAIDTGLTNLQSADGGEISVKFDHRGWIEDGTDLVFPQQITLMPTTESDKRRCASVETLLGSLRKGKDDSCQG